MCHNTATHMQLIGHSMLDVSRLRALQLSSRQHCIARSSQFYVAFCYAVIAHISFHAYLTTYLLLFFANFQRFISTDGV